MTRNPICGCRSGAGREWHFLDPGIAGNTTLTMTALAVRAAEFLATAALGKKVTYQLAKHRKDSTVQQTKVGAASGDVATDEGKTLAAGASSAA